MNPGVRNYAVFSLNIFQTHSKYDELYYFVIFN
jgi:hypothetical protein